MSRDYVSKEKLALRRKAEKTLVERPKRTPATTEEWERVLHELDVHEIELEMQNNELRTAQAVIEDSRSRYVDLYDYAPVGYLTFNGEGLVSELNLAAAALLGVGRGLITNKPFAGFIHPDSQDIFYLHRRKVLETGTKHTCELLVRRKGGGVFNAQLESIRSQTDGSFAVRSVLTDITERTKKNEELFQLNKTLKALGAINNAMIHATTESEYMKTACRIIVEDCGHSMVWIGFAQDDEGKTVRPVAYAGFEEGYLEALRITWADTSRGRGPTGTAIRTGKPSICANILIDPRFAPWRAEATKRGYASSIVFPLVAGERTFGAMTLYSTETDAFSTDEMKLLSEVARDIAYGITTIRLRDEHARAEEALRRAYDELDLRVQERTAELQKAYESLREQTAERERLEAQIRQAQKMEALGTLAGGIAHDFNNILAAVIGFTELLSSHAVKGSRDARHLGRVMEASLRGRELVRQMLMFSRKTEEEKKPLRLSSVVKETIKFLRASTPMTIGIKTKIAGESGLVLADPTQIQQVIINLCANAVYAMRNTGGVLEIELSDFSATAPNESDASMQGPCVKLVVRDTGAGIAPHLLDKIFDPFFTTKKVGEGTGLGLSVVHGIVRSINGHITVESEPGKGSVFSVCFPSIGGETEGKAATARDDGLPTGHERILFVDDEEALVEMGEDILAELGYDVTSRTNSREALALFRLNPSRFDLVITDQTMPELTGIDFSKEILFLRPGMPIIMCTGFSHTMDADKAEAAGIGAFVMKPLTKRELAATVRRVLDDQGPR